MDIITALYHLILVTLFLVMDIITALYHLILVTLFLVMDIITALYHLILVTLSVIVLMQEIKYCHVIYGEKQFQADIFSFI